MKEDIEKRAEEYAKESILIDDPSYTSGLFYGYLAGATEERERGKRFAEWASEHFTYNAKNNEWKHKGSHLIISTDELFDMFLPEEKALNN